MPLQPSGIAPYAPSASILSVIERARERGLPTPVTKEVLGRIGISESLISRTLQALQLLELINEDGTWTQNLENLRRCPEPEFQPRLAEIVRSVYEDIFSFVDPTKDSITVMRDAFRAFTPHGQQDRMVTLFLGLCKRSGIISSDSIPKGVHRGKRQIIQKKPTPLKTTAKTKTVEKHDFIGISGLPPPLAGLLSALPVNGNGWSQNDRDRFLKAFESMLDYSIPIQDSQSSTDKNELGDES
ncbi:MAG: DUF5343 domain-containing protein [Thiobacillaceae bacterium]